MVPRLRSELLALLACAMLAASACMHVALIPPRAAVRDVKCLGSALCLRLRGGQGGDGSEELTNENVRRHLNDSLHEYDPETGGPGFRKTLPDELTCSALDVIRLRFVPRDALSNSAAHQAFPAYPPLFAHQLFGEDECIYGYFSPEIDIAYAEDSLLPAIIFTHIPQGNADGVGAVPRGATDVLGAIQSKAPADYFSPDQLQAPRKRFEPRGSFVCDYSGYALGRSRDEHAVVESQRGGDVRYQVFEVRAGADIGSTKVLLQRAQSLAMWMIESASYIDLQDPSWSCLFVYEKTVPWAGVSRGTVDGKETADFKEAVGSYRLVAFATLYRRRLADGMDLESLRQVSPRADELWESRENFVRLNISQFVVLPHFQDQGHGKQLLRAVYKAAQADTSVLDVNVEAPTEVFSRLRHGVELEIVKEHDKVEALRRANPPWIHLQSKLKFSMPRLFVIAREVGCKAGIAGVGQDDQGQPTVAGVQVDLESVYSRASLLGFTREELDDILQTIQPEDMQGTSSAQEAADRLLSSVYMAVVSDVGEAEGLTPQQVDELMGRVDADQLLKAANGRDIARLILPLIHQIKAGSQSAVL